MAGRTVHLRVGGQTYRVVTSASEDELKHLAAMVDEKIASVVPAGRTVTPQAMLLAAMALAHDLEEERARSASIAAKARTVYGRIIERVDAAICEVDRGAAPVVDGPGWGPNGRPANES